MPYIDCSGVENVKYPGDDYQDEPQRRMSVSAKHPKAENMLDVEDGEKKDGEEKVKEEGNDLQLK